MTPGWKRFGWMGLLCLALPAALAHADDDDHDLARDLYEHGEIHSLPDILGLVAARVPGEVVAVTLLRADQRWVYRLEVVTADGHKLVVDVDAENLTPIERADSH